MRSIIVFLMCLILTAAIPAQSQKSESEMRKEAKEKKKAQEARESDSLFHITDSLVKGRMFVLEANVVQGSKGTRFRVTPDLNFIYVDSAYGVVQIGSAQFTGYNGVGGATEEGRITNWKVDRNEKKKNFYIKMTLQSKFGIFDINMNVGYDGHSYADLNGMRYGSLSYEGNLVPVEKSAMYKGRSK